MLSSCFNVNTTKNNKPHALVVLYQALCQIVLVENQNNKINKQLKSEKRFGLQSKPLLIWKH